MKNSGLSTFSSNAFCDAFIVVLAYRVSFDEDVSTVNAITRELRGVNLMDEELVNLSQHPYGN